MEDKSCDFSSVSDGELDITIDELGEAEANAEALEARALEAKNAPMAGISGALKKSFRDGRYARLRVRHEEIQKLLNEALGEKAHRQAIRKTLPALLADVAEVERLLAEDAADSEEMQIHIVGLAAAALRKESRMAQMRRLESGLESRQGGWLGAVSFAGSVLRPNDQALALRTALHMALKQSRTYANVAQISGLRSPEESRRDFAAVSRRNGERLLQKFQQEIDRIKERKSA